jgi:16S rRNA (uracil1498-N3)-methyltransferase
VSGFRPRFFIAEEATLSSQTGSLTPGAELTLGPADSYHALRVLRLKAGDACEVVVGAAVYAASVSGAKTPVSVTVESRLQGQAAGAVYRSQVGLAQALTRPALLDEVLEKGTEVGSSFFVLVPAAESTRLPESARAGRLERWRRIVLEAAKQSKHLAVPTVELAASLDAALQDFAARGVRSLVLEPSAQVSLRERLEQMRAPSSSSPGRGPAALALWIGPESGWSEAELRWFAESGVEAVKLGQSVLRAETAGPVAVAVTRLVVGD